MNAVLGPFHPHLENAVVNAIRKQKSKKSMSPLLILVPSDSLRRRLKICLAAEHRMNLLNVHLLTFHQLYLRLFEESEPGSAIFPADDFIIEEALSHCIKTAPSETASFLPIAEKAGGCGALWQTLRDLKDGGVNAVSLMSGLDEGVFDERDKEKLARLITLYESFTDSCRQWGLYDYKDFVSSVRERVTSSAFLNQFERIFYYGFYDLTQVQLDVFYEVARQYPTTLFFPLMRGHVAWIFAQRFYERYLQGLASEQKYLSQPDSDFRWLPLFADETPSPAPQTANRPKCVILSCSGPRDEIVTVAKEILRLNRDEGLAFSEMGVVARALEPYTGWIQEVFRDHRIPIFTSAEEPLLLAPLAKSVILLLNLAGKDYLRSHFADLVSSPYFNLRSAWPEQFVPRPDLWDVLTRRLGITKGAEEWTRLKRYLDRDLEFTAPAEDGDETRTISIASEQVAILWRVFAELHHDLSGLPTEATWSDYVESWQGLLQKYLNLGDPEALTVDSPDQMLKKTIAETLNDLSTLDSIHSRPSLSQFVLTLHRCLEAKTVPISDQNIAGVTVLDAMAARGSRFQTLFIVGLNEGLFPRKIREDAFLRDRTRRVLETVLGYKVSEKLAAFDEEKLLFALLIGAADDRLYGLYHRSDETGGALEPSWYVTELRRIFSTEPVPIPRSIRARTDFEPFRRSEILLPEELAIWLSLRNKNIEGLLKHFPETASLCQRGNKLLEVIENAGGRLCQYDGLTGHLADYWERFSRDGVAPTSLERYARCPFQFFALNVLKLRVLERPEDQTVVSASDTGQLIHRILKDCFQELIDRGYFSPAEPSIDPEALLEASAQKAFRDHEAENPTGYPLVWENLQQTIIALLKQIIALDLQELLRSGRQPVVLETQLQSRFPASWPEPASSLILRGTVDRIDFDPSENRLRVIDYKYKSGRKPLAADTNLLRAALRGEKLQPPLYALLAREYGKLQNTIDPAIEVALHYLAPNWDSGPFMEKIFSAHDWDGLQGQRLSETIYYLIDGIHQGRYFIHPGEACEYCQVAQACRKDHLPTAWRTANDPLTAAHFDLAKKDAPKEADD
ncbi:MAG: PD-(D/E)XK nuclease family protein [Candidatus Binatia bacterium]